MTVYVDELRRWGLWRFGDSCHLTADSIEELHEFAHRSGMKRAWFQNRAEFPHYDLSAKRRQRAVSHGAIETTGRERIKAMRQRPPPPPPPDSDPGVQIKEGKL